MKTSLLKKAFKYLISQCYNILSDQKLGTFLQGIVSLATIASIIWGVEQFASGQKDEAFSSSATAWQLLEKSNDGQFGQIGAVELLDRHGASMSGLKLHGVDLTSGDFKGAILPLAMFVSSNLNNVDLRRSNLSNAIFDWSDMSFANLSQAEGNVKSVRGVNFTGTILPERDKSNFVDMVIAEGCVNKLGPMPADSIGQVTVPRQCPPLVFGQAPCLRPWCNAKYSYAYYEPNSK